MDTELALNPNHVSALNGPEHPEIARLLHLMEVVRGLSSDPDPVSSVNRFREGVRGLYGDQGMISISTRGLEPGHYRVMRVLHQSGLDQQRFPSTEFAGVHAPVCSGGLIGEIIERGRPAVLRDLRVEFDPVMAHHLSPYRILVATPVFDAGVATNWVFFMGTDPASFLRIDVESRILQANLLGGMANSKRAAQELRQATALIMREVDEIANIQRGLLPSPLPIIPGVELAAVHQTFDRAGGDYYDVFPVYPPSHETGSEYSEPWAFLIADASGHGASAAVVIAMLSTLVHSRLRGVERPGELLEFVNNHLVTKPINGSFVTAFLVFYYPTARFARYASAGHNPPYVQHRDGSIRLLNAVGEVPLGIDRHAQYADAELHLQVGDRLLLYTDGITEARAPSGRLFGEERLEDAIRASDISAEALIDQVLLAVRQHQAGQRPSDDQTMLALRITGPADDSHIG